MKVSKLEGKGGTCYLVGFEEESEEEAKKLEGGCDEEC